MEKKDVHCIEPPYEILSKILHPPLTLQIGHCCEKPAAGRTNPINRGPTMTTMMLLYTPDFSLPTLTCHLRHDLVNHSLSRVGVWSVPTDESQPRHHIGVVHLSDNGPLWLSQQGLGWSSGGGQRIGTKYKLISMWAEKRGPFTLKIEFCISGIETKHS